MTVSQSGPTSRSSTETKLTYVPYHELNGQPNVIVDGSPTEGTVLTLSHWPQSPCPPGLEADLSAEMAFAYSERLDLHGDARAVSNNHFDQDGLVSLFALIHPELALPRREILVDLARAGDFATFSNRDAARASMVISAFADPARSPLGWGGDDYPQWTSQLYGELLPRVVHICEHVEDYRDTWDEEDATLDASEEALASGRVRIEEDPRLDLAIVHVPADAPGAGGHLFAGDWRTGLHPMAINNATDRLTLLVITDRRCQLFYRYESWVQYRSARPKARVDLVPLAAELNSLETTAGNWIATKVSTIAPKLEFRSESDGKDRSDGQDGESAISPDLFTEMAKAHLATAPAAWNPYSDG